MACGGEYYLGKQYSIKAQVSCLNIPLPDRLALMPVVRDSPGIHLVACSALPL